MSKFNQLGTFKIINAPKGIFGKIHFQHLEGDCLENIDFVNTSSSPEDLPAAVGSVMRFCIDFSSTNLADDAVQIFTLLNPLIQANSHVQTTAQHAGQVHTQVTSQTEGSLKFGVTNISGGNINDTVYVNVLLINP